MYNTYRVMAEQETGEECCYANNLSADDACTQAVRAREEHVEWRHVWVELEENRHLFWKGVYEDDEQDLY